MNSQNFLQGVFCFVLVRKYEWMNPTNLCNGHQVRHPLKVVGREIGISSRSDLGQSVVDLYTEFLLEVAVLGRLPERKGHLEDS